MDFYVIGFIVAVCLLVAISVVTIVDARIRRREAEEEKEQSKTLEEVLEEEYAKKAYIYAKNSELINWLIEYENKGKMDLSLLSKGTRKRSAALLIKAAEDDHAYAIAEYDRVSREIGNRRKLIIERPDLTGQVRLYENDIKTLEKQKEEIIIWVAQTENLLEGLAELVELKELDET